jgi:WD40 repeat protein
MRLGTYEVMGELGRGGMGVVLRARAADGRDVAIKVLLKPGSANAVARFDRERRLLAGLGKAEGFVALLDAGSSPKGPYVVMPFVAGGTLRAKLTNGPLGVEETAALGEALATSLGKAHALGIVHRDLKPENILFEGPAGAGRPLVADLGLAKHFFADEAARSVSLSKTGELKGTAGYMAPEQMNDAKSVGPPADVFAIGAILYECLTGQEAFGGDSAHARIFRVASGQFEPIRRVRPQTPRWLAKIVQRTLASDPAKRYADGNALALALASRGAGDRPAWLIPAAAAASCATLALALFASTLGRRPDTPPVPAETATPTATAPTPAPTKKPGHALPDFTRKFEKTRRTRLAAVLGDPAWKLPNGGGAVSFVDDKRYAVASGFDVFICDAATGRQLRRIPLTIGNTMSLETSPDGTRLLVTGHEQLSTVVEISSGVELAQLKGQFRQIYSGHWFPDGQRVATASDDDGSLRVWEAGTGEQIWAGRGHQCVWSCAVSPDGKWIVTSGVADGPNPKPDGGWARKGWNVEHTSEAMAPPEDRSDFALRLWDAATGRIVRALVGHRQFAHCVTFSPDGTRIASCGWDTTVRVWDTATGDLLRTLEGHVDAVRCVRFAGPDELVSCGLGSESTVRVWDLRKPPGSELVATFTSQLGGVGDVSVSRDGRRALSTGVDGTVRLWDLEGLKEISKVSGHAGPVIGIGAPAETKLVVTGGRDGTVRSWDLVEARESASRATASFASAFALAPDAVRALVGHDNGTMDILDLASGASQTVTAHQGRVGAVAFLPRGDRAQSAGADRKSRQWDIRWNTEAGGFDAFAAPTALSISGDGTTFLLVSREEGLLVWNDTNRGTFLKYDIPAASAVLASDARAAFVATANHALASFQFDVGPRVFAENHPVELVAVTSDYRLGAAATSSGVIELWDMQKGLAVDSIPFGTEDRVTALAFAHDDRALYVGTACGVTLAFELVAR